MYNSRKKPVLDYAKHKRSSKELAKSFGSNRNSIYVPKTKKVGFCASLSPHNMSKISSSSSTLSAALSPSPPPSSPSSSSSEINDDFKPALGEKLNMPTRKKPLPFTASTGGFNMPMKQKTLPFTASTGGLNMPTKKKPLPFTASSGVLNMPTKRKTDESPEFIMPPKKIRTGQDEKEIDRLIESLDKFQKNDEREFDEDQRVCRFCSESLFPITRPISKALQMQEKEDKEYAKRQKEYFEDMNASSSFSRPVGFVSIRPVPVKEQDEFCKLHRLELVIKPEGIKEGYPNKINFENIQNDIKQFDLELKRVIKNTLHSDYRDLAEKAYKEQGETKARSAMSVMNRFSATLPGYYGPRGAAIILKTLTTMYADTGYLQDHLVSSQLPLEFLQQVLVPEVGFRLIRRDLITKGRLTNANTRAKSIMKDSTDYGNAMFPVNEDEDEDQEIYVIDD